MYWRKKFLKKEKINFSELHGLRSWRLVEILKYITQIRYNGIIEKAFFLNK
jgi:hypothetical protein